MAVSNAAVDTSGGNPTFSGLALSADFAAQTPSQGSANAIAAGRNALSGLHLALHWARGLFTEIRNSPIQRSRSVHFMTNA